MKKVFYSVYTKLAVVVLFVICIVSGAVIASDGIIKFSNEKEQVYGFESSFENTRYFSHYLLAPQMAVRDCFYEEVNPENISLEYRIEEKLENLYCYDKINYYVKINDTVFTNCEVSSVTELMQSDFYSYITKDYNGNIEIDSKPELQTFYLTPNLFGENEDCTVTICTSIKDSFIDECFILWYNQREIVYDAFFKIFVLALVALFSLIYLICVCGKDAKGNKKRIWVDYVWMEVHLAVFLGVCAGVVVACAVILDACLSGHFPYNLTSMVVGVISALASIIVITSLLSVVRNIKCRKFLETSITLRVLRWAYKLFVKIIVKIFGKSKEYKKIFFGMFSKKTGIILNSMLFVYTCAIGLFGIFTAITFPVWIILGIMLFVFASLVIAYRSKDVDEIKKGVREVRSGNSSYKIPELKSEDLKILAEDINDITKGTEEAVSAKLKAEKMKTELITNVSHDLKTPLTSIINYTELLANIEGLPEEAEDYIQIISQKCARLKALTQDLFDISKVQSGNETVDFEKLDTSLLINQALAEYDSDIKTSHLTFCVNVEKDLYIYADGRKMSRVIGNLLNNILKYTMKETRVFITALEKDGNVIMEFKNIASYPMDFNADEITGRFVRGDKSRNSEGNGLGLAICASYLEICKGEFDVITDGDMFKAIVKFKKYTDK